MSPISSPISPVERITPALLRIRPSQKFGGIGVFALRDIPKGTILSRAAFLPKERFLSWKAFRKLDEITQEFVRNFCAHTKRGVSLPADLSTLPIVFHMNHHCRGNVGSDEAGNFLAIRKVRCGEELCFDYALVISDPKYRLICRCGDPLCRKVITGNDWKDPNFLENNYRYMSPVQRALVDAALHLDSEPSSEFSISDPSLHRRGGRSALEAKRKDKSARKKVC